MSTSVCSGTGFTVIPVDVTNGVVPSGTTYSWPAPSPVTGITGLGSGSNASNITGTLTNATNASIDVIYTVTPTADGCTGNTFNVTVTVDPVPAITGMSTPVCSAAQFNVTPVNGTNGVVPSSTTYSWAAPSGTGFTGGASGSGSDISGTLTNTTSTAQTATYTVTPTAGNCTGSTFTVTVTVNPVPAINAMITTVCSGTEFIVTPADGTDGIVPSNTTYSWDAPSGTGFTGGASGSGSDISGTLTNTTSTTQTATYNVTPTAGSCTGTPFTVTVTLNPTPSISAMNTTVCGGTEFTVAPADGTNGIVPSGTTYSWDTPAGTGFTGGASGSGQVNISGTLTNTTSTVQTATYNVTPTAGDNCTGTSFTVTVTLNPTPAISAMITTVCGGTEFTVVPADGTNGIVPSGTTYSWDAPSGTGFTGGASGSGQVNISGTLTNTTSTVQTATYTVTPTAGNSCTGSTFTVTVTLNPTPVISAMTTTVCGGTEFTIAPANGTNGIVPDGTTYSWDTPAGTGFTGGASGSGQVNISGTLTNTTSTAQTATYTVTPVTGNSCTGTSFTVTVTLNPTPAISAMTTTVCGGTEFTVTPADGINGIVPSGTTYSWDAPSGTGFTGGASGSGSNITGTLTNTTNTAQTATYTVTPTAGDNCTGTSFTVTVTLNPIPAISAMNTTVCGGTEFTVTPADGTNGIVPSGTTYSWNVPSGTGFTGGASGSGSNITGTLTNTTNTAQTATYTVTPTAGDNCTGTSFTVTVTLNPTPVISAMTTTVCGGTEFTVAPANGTNGIVPDGTTYSWDTPAGTGFTGGASGSGQVNISGTLTNTTSTAQTATYTVTPVTGNNCTGTSFTVTVTLNPTPAISAMITTVCSGTEFIVTPADVTNGIVPSGTTYSWDAPSGTGFTGGASGSGQVNISGTSLSRSVLKLISAASIFPDFKKAIA